MKLVLQAANSTACQQACYAMLAGVALEEITARVGDGRLAVEQRQKIVTAYQIKLDVWKSFPVAPFAYGAEMKSIAALMKDHRTLLCSVYDYKDLNYGHSVIIHDGDLYDPWAGLNPQWPWSRVIGCASPVEDVS